MLSVSIGTLCPYMLSWGSIFIQDVIMPLRGKRLEPKEHMNLLRWSVLGVALFAFLFSLFFPQNDYIFMFLIITGTIWLGGAGAVIIGGLYWKRGTTTGAYAAVIIGMITALVGLILPRIWPRICGTEFPINSQWMRFIAIISASVSYIVVSLLCKKNMYNLDKLLNRGEYAAIDSAAANNVPVKGLRALFGMGREFTFKDRVIYSTIISFNIALAVIFIAGTIYNLLFDVSVKPWIAFWHFYLWMVLIICIITTVWFTCGATINLRTMYKTLKTMVRDTEDDGTVNKDSNRESGKE
jgi:SSS family solute:Na+ symporter